MGKTPRVTLALPVYNGENYIRETLNSLLNQTYGDFELIITDNESTDGTRAICETFVARDPRVQYFRNPRNLGAA
ncbi:MAG: glycosyltransferase, partial [Alphaproteobacteria bacterium]|nr:glycosyltransferase [Alphaproteobacteria bacterium]